MMSDRLQILLKNQSFKRQTPKVVKHTQTNSLSVFGYLVGLAFFGLSEFKRINLLRPLNHRST